MADTLATLEKRASTEHGDQVQAQPTTLHDEVDEDDGGSVRGKTISTSPEGGDTQGAASSESANASKLARLAKRTRRPSVPDFLKPDTRLMSSWERVKAFLWQELNFYVSATTNSCAHPC